MTIRVMLMRRDDLTVIESYSLVSFYPPGTEFHIERRDPVDFLQHDAMCEGFKPDVVILPREKPVPVLAMEKGIPHISMTPKGFKRLRRVPPDFVDFIPGQELPPISSDEERHGSLDEVVYLLKGDQSMVDPQTFAILVEMRDELRRRIDK